MLRRLMPLLFLCVLASGCAGGGGSTLPQTTGNSAPAGGPVAGTRTVTVSIAIPAATATSSGATRKPLYVSPNTNSIAIAVNGGTPVVTNVSSNSPSCTTAVNGSRTCTVAISAPVGNDTFTESTYASTDGTGPALSQTTNTAAIISAGQANVVKLTLGGVVATISLSLDNPTPPLGSTSLPKLTATFRDASGATIFGSDPFVNPVTLTDSDGSGTTKLATTSISSPAGATVTVTYNGGALPNGAIFGATATGVPASGVTTATLTPSAATTTGFVDWSTYAFDSQRSGFNPNSTAISPSSIAQLHLAWQQSTQGGQTQPLVLTNVGGHQALVVVSSYVNAQAYDALSGTLAWQTTLPKQDVQSCGTAGISGTPQYVKTVGAGSLFMVAGNGGGSPNHVILYRLDAASGKQTGSVDVTPSLLPGEANSSHAGVSYANGRIYVGTGSDCEGSSSSAYPSWRGSVVSVDPNNMSVLSTFYTTYGQGGNFGGGGVWSWGGVAADPSGNIYLAAGNSETNDAVPQGIKAPFQPTTNEQAGYGEHLVKVSGDLSHVFGSNYPGFDFKIGCCDLDYTGVPVVYQPPVQNNCGMLSATQGKGGTLVINNTENVAEVNSFALSVPSADAFYMGNPAYSPNTGLLYAPISSSGNGSSLLPPGLAAIGGCGSSITWHAQFGPDSTAFSGDNPRSAPTVTAGGIVLISTPCTNNGGTCGSGGAANGALWAVDASSGTVYGNGKPLLITGNNIRMPATVSGKWVFVYDTGGHLSALTIDPSVPAKTASVVRGSVPSFAVRGK